MAEQLNSCYGERRLRSQNGRCKIAKRFVAWSRIARIEINLFLPIRGMEKIVEAAI